jgi:hypothetical protein
MRWKVFQLIYHTLIISDKSFIGDWEIVTLEEWMVRPNLRKLIASKINDAILRLTAASTSPPDTEPISQSDIKSQINAVQGFLFPSKTWDHLMEDDRLPRQAENGKILYELDHNVLLVREVPSLAHDAASRSIIPAVLFWSSNGFTLPQSLKMLGGGGFFTV